MCSLDAYTKNKTKIKKKNGKTHISGVFLNLVVIGVWRGHVSPPEAVLAQRVPRAAGTSVAESREGSAPAHAAS